ncbi:helix-turn-helix domain-containing protein [Xanthocytophaga agilis]|uniref:Helix-turn-helix domain-containing protein n=1 Tax=Xanthocytophaga agilis TaxID=3048010 RepID=A0AAE3R182_9BACT|nr:helix-turn-helix domain-containing protein [Xanthocytophaga agilis]MDJ1501854.1 helix-turn-helix domain-containing protein [Xanthocytophaga agilis]
MELEDEIKTLTVAFQEFLIGLTKQQINIVRSEVYKMVESIEDQEREALMKMDDVAKELQVSKATISVWLKQGKIPGHYISNRLFFFRKEIYAAIRNEPSLEKYKRIKKRKANRTR